MYSLIKIREEGGRPMRKLFTLLLSSIFLSIAVSVQASVIPIGGGGYEVNYDFEMRNTLYGNDITDIFIFETDGTQVNVDDYSFSVAATGPATISHDISFDPTLALVLGLDRAPLDSGNKDHLVVFMDNDFAVANALGKKFSEAFPAVDGRDRVRHSIIVQAIKDSQLGDLDALQSLTDFFVEDAGKFAAFDPENSFSVVEFTSGTRVNIPVPSTLPLFGIGLAGLAARRKWKKKAVDKS